MYGMQNDLISRQSAIDAISKDVMGGLNYRSILRDLPSICQGQQNDNSSSSKPERPTGEWKEHIFDGIMGGKPRALVCSYCNYISLNKTNFCPNCGSYNRGEHDGTM